MLDISQAGHVIEVVLNRPEKKNALNMAFLERLEEAGPEVGATDGLRAVVMRGAGGCFSAGIDLGLLQDVAGRLDDIKHQMRNPPDGVANLFQKPMTVWRDIPVPVIAAIEGVCFGAGLQLALAADFRIAHPDTRFSIMETKWGLVPDMGLTQFLPGQMRADVAKELIMTARVLTAAEALDLGLITRISDDPVKAAHDMAQALADRSPDAIRFAKQLVDAAWGGDPANLELEADLQTRLMGSTNQMETVFAQMQKRKPNYT